MTEEEFKCPECKKPLEKAGRYATIDYYCNTTGCSVVKVVVSTE